MKQFLLKEILNLTDEEVMNSKIGLNIHWAGRAHFEDWYESNPENRYVDFSYYSHQGGRRNFKEGQMCFGFVRMPGRDKDKWLLVTAGVVTKVPPKEKPDACEHVEIKKFQSLLGRLIIRLHTGNTYSRYIFNLSHYIDKAVVEEILPKEYEPIQFNGYENVHLTFSRLKTILHGEKYSAYREALGTIKGVYCLTDTNTGKCYIGSASSENGILQRWNDYVTNCDGSNQALIELHKEKGDKYFEDNFYYSLLEVFSRNTEKQKVLDRETYWKEIFQTKENGYNRN